MRFMARFLALFATLAAASAQAQTPAAPVSRAEATTIIADARRIVTPNGVERLEKVRIGGIDRWVSIRGADRRNPVYRTHDQPRAASGWAPLRPF